MHIHILTVHCRPEPLDCLRHPHHQHWLSRAFNKGPIWQRLSSTQDGDLLPLDYESAPYSAVRDVLIKQDGDPLH